MTDRIDDLRAIFSRLGGSAEFTEPQERPRGSIRPDRAVDRDLRSLVADLRERYGFRTVLSDDDLARLVRGFYAGRSDRELAADLGVSSATVFRARMNLQLFRHDDAPPALDPAVPLLRAGDSPERLAAEFGVSKAALERLRRLLSAREVARRVNYRYATEFADLLDVNAADLELDRQLWDSRRVLVDAHD